jgi:hypothetical protein
MDLAGCGPERKPLPDGGPGQSDEEKFGSIDLPPGDQWTCHAVANVILAHSLVRSFPEVDARRTAVTGISWGGYLTCIVAGLDSRFRAAVPVYGCGFLDENSVWLGRFEKMTPEQRTKWVRITVNMPHGHKEGWAPAEIGLFIDEHLTGGTPLPQILHPQFVHGQIRAKVQTKTQIVSAALHCTTDPAPINKRQWQDVPARVEGSHLIAAAPPKEATIWFLTATDARNATVSSELTFAPGR